MIRRRPPPFVLIFTMARLARTVDKINTNDGIGHGPLISIHETARNRHHVLLDREPAAWPPVTDPAQRLNANTPACRSTATREIPRAAGELKGQTG
jgi:hypothetical protein